VFLVAKQRYKSVEVGYCEAAGDTIPVVSVAQKRSNIYYILATAYGPATQKFKILDK